MTKRNFRSVLYCNLKLNIYANPGKSYLGPSLPFCLMLFGKRTLARIYFLKCL